MSRVRRAESPFSGPRSSRQSPAGQASVKWRAFPSPIVSRLCGGPGDVNPQPRRVPAEPKPKGDAMIAASRRQRLR